MDMRKLIKLIEDKSSKSNKIDRTTFLYMSPKGDKDEFAQCGTCFMFMPEKQRCSIFSKDDKVLAKASCALYVYGEPNDEQEFKNSISPKEAGYVEGKVRCENCNWLDPGNVCGFFKMLNEKMGDTFDLKETVDPKGCCNAWEGKH